MEKIDLLIKPESSDGQESSSEAVRELRASLKSGGISYASRIFTRDSEGADGTYLGEAVALTTAILTAVTTVLVAWMKARYGRRLRLRLNDKTEVEASTPEEIARILEAVNRHQKGDRDAD